MDLDNVTASVLVGTKGVLTFDSMIMQVGAAGCVGRRIAAEAKGRWLFNSQHPLPLPAFLLQPVHPPQTEPQPQPHTPGLQVSEHDLLALQHPAAAECVQGGGLWGDPAQEHDGAPRAGFGGGPCLFFGVVLGWYRAEGVLGAGSASAALAGELESVSSQTLNPNPQPKPTPCWDPTPQRHTGPPNPKPLPQTPNPQTQIGPRTPNPKSKPPNPQTPTQTPQVHVANTELLIKALNALPGGASSAPEVPDLRPLYVGGRAPGLNATGFGIKSWQVGSRSVGAGFGVVIRVCYFKCCLLCT